MFKILSTYIANLIFLILAFVGGEAYHLYTKPSIFSHARLFIVDKGTTLTQISNKLANESLISQPALFKYSTFLMCKSSGIRAGEYEIPAHSSMHQIFEILSSGKFYEHNIVIPEGFTVYQIMERLNSEKALSGDISKIILKEGSLMPTSLQYLRGTDRAVILKRLVDAQKKRVELIWKNRDKSIPLKNRDELVTLASIIEKEVNVSKERYLVASVFYNRLNKHIKLQSDPTVVYGIYGGKGKSKSIPIYKSDLENDNSYNTYKIFGLPKAAISNPGYDALYAAAHPVKTNFLYFVSAGNGGHIFSEKLEKHIEAVKNMRNRAQQQKNKLFTQGG